MSVSLIAKNGDETNTSNGEWAAITAMAEAFGVIERKWNGYHDDDVFYTPDQLREMAKRAEQIGRAAPFLCMLADGGGLVGLS